VALSAPGPASHAGDLAGPDGDRPQPGQAALDHLVVLDLSDGVAGQYCTRTMADYGARVVLVEPPGGSQIRRRAAWTGPRDPGQDCDLFHHLNAGKESMTLDWRTASGLEVLRRLAADVDVVVAPDEQVCRDLQRRYPHLVTCWISSFGEGPHGHWTGTEMVFQALSGVMLLNGQHPHPPLYGIGERAQYSAGVTAYGSILAALLWREGTGKGQYVEAAVLDAVVAMNATVPIRHFYNGTHQTRLPRSGLVGLFEAADGWIVVYAARPNDWASCCAVFGLGDSYLDDERFVDLGNRLANWEQAVDLIAKRVITMSCEEIVAAGRVCKLPVSRVMDADALAGDLHLSTRGFWEVDSSGSRPVLAPAFRMSRTPRRVPVPAAPELGASGPQVLAEFAAVTAEDARVLQGQGVTR
jgi:crotonobetainyl-CoA:carnitine CoA-transferase CaiB-like acyl-CoA transferase